MQHDEEETKVNITQVSKEQEGVENTNPQEEVSEEVVENLVVTRDSQQNSQMSVLNTVKFSTLPSEINSFESIKQTSEYLKYIKNIAEELIGSQLCPFKKVEDAVLAIITGMQYNFPFMTSINNIYPVNGKPAMSTHLHRALVIQKGIIFKKLYNYEPIYKFAIKKDKGDGTKETISVGIGTLLEKQEGWIASIEPVDRITKYSFSRKIKQLDGTYETLTTESEFKLSDAIQAGLANKDNWKNFPQRMLDARAFSIGAKEIASDILLGIYTISELAEQHNLDYIISPTLEESIIQ